MFKLPKRMLVDTFEYAEFIGEDDYQQAEYKDPVTVNFVRIDRQTVFSRNGKNETIQANAVIYTDANHTNVKEFTEQSKALFDGKEYIITKVTPKVNVNTSDIIGYELEVV